MTEHKCDALAENDGVSINKKDHQPYWIIEDSSDDPNDPCYGVIIILYCPFCGEKLS